MDLEIKKRELMDALSAAYSDPKVKKDKDLQNMIYEFAQEIETTKNIVRTCTSFIPKMNTLVAVNAFHVLSIPNTVYKVSSLVQEISSANGGIMGLVKEKDDH